MDRYITGVAYRHALLTAYVRVVGHTEAEAHQRAKRVGTVLQERMPQDAAIGVPRYKGFAAGTARYDIPIVIAACEGRARSEIAKLVLRGAA